jgi:sulfite reductase alpha subunit-like flavoprotein
MIKENGEYLARLIVESEAWIYVSGRAKFMPKSVDKAFESIIDEYYENGK